MTKQNNPRLTVDAIIERNNRILLIRRKGEVFHNYLAIPGGFVDYGEQVETAVIREMKEELGIKIKITGILGVYSDEDRDPRGHICSIVFVCQSDESPVAGDDAKEIEWIEINEINSCDLAFDHKMILQDYNKWRENHCTTFWSSKSE